MEDNPDGRGLNRSQANDVLRYWLAALRLEEALDSRPQARRSSAVSTRPRLDLPTPGQDYFKVPLDRALAGLLGPQATESDAATEARGVHRAFDGELTGFFETWLHGQYRRGEEEGELSHLLCFPVVHLPRGELAGLLRCGVRLRFGNASGKTFRAPSRADRQRNVYPDPPDEVRIASLPRAEGAWPFFVDTRLLRHPLGVPSESIDALFDALRAEAVVSERKMLALLTRMLENVAHESGSASVSPPPQAAERDDVESWLERLHRAMRRLLEQTHTRAQVYPVGIVLDGTQAKTSWHLQRELNGLLEETADKRWTHDSALGAYLTGRAPAAGDGIQRALFPGPPLTPNQRQAAARFWGSTLTAVQGPPGTGKTTMILHLCAEVLANQVAGLIDGRTMGEGLFLIASSNNRAVDNVMDPLCAVEGLPLALRVGSRQVCEKQLVAQLQRTLSWLRRAREIPPADRTQELARALTQFRAAQAQLDAIFAPYLRAMSDAKERTRVEASIAALPPPSDLSATAHQAQAQPLLAALLPLERRLQALSKLCEAEPGLAQVNSLAHHYGRTAARELPAFEDALASAGLKLDLPLPPLVTPMDLPQLMESWEEATELCLSRLADLRETIERRIAAHEIERLRAELAKKLAAMALAPASPPPDAHEALSYQLFDAAVAVREAWAKQHAHELCSALESTLRVVEAERSLRPLFRADPVAVSWLRKLFGIWGSTLLSLGNCLPPDAGSVARVVIDEAGQCHPAHVVSALMRADAAMLIGDVHQLTPVIELATDDEERLLRACRLRTPEPLLAPYRVGSERPTSAQALADRAVHEKLCLTDHFRCQSEIIALSDALCAYGLKVHTQRADRSASAPFLLHPVLLADVPGAQERLAGSLCNELELSHTLQLVERLLAQGIAPSELAVITPYRGQLERLRRGLLDRRIPLEYSVELGEGEGARFSAQSGLALGTVHRFQGGERSIVVFSSVITKPSSLPFLNARPNLLNVAISRAQHHFVCLGHRAVLAQGQRTRLLTQTARPLPCDSFSG